MALSVAFGLAAGYGGLLLSFFLNLPSGPAIVLVGGGLYVVSLVTARFMQRHAVAKG
jgi:zinc/manganese transport system permease protein